MKQHFNRRDFVKTTSLAGLGLVIGTGSSAVSLVNPPEGKRIGIIGLDTSHSIAFSRIFNDPLASKELGGFKVVAAYPKGSEDIEVSVSRIAGFTKEIQSLGVKIVSSIKELLESVDVVLLETNDGRLHFEQALPVLKAGKRIFIDKPLAASLPEVIAIIEASKHYKVPVFSSSSLRYFENIADLIPEKTGKILGAGTYSPATLESTHTDLYWYGIHGVEMLYTLMRTGCKSVRQITTDETDIVVGVWNDNRIGTFRGIRSGKKDYGGQAFGERDIVTINPGDDYGYKSLMVKVAEFFQTGKSPVSMEETLEIYTFMSAAQESKRQEGAEVDLKTTLEKARKEVKQKW